VCEGGREKGGGRRDADGQDSSRMKKNGKNRVRMVSEGGGGGVAVTGS